MGQCIATCPKWPQRATSAARRPQNRDTPGGIRSHEQGCTRGCTSRGPHVYAPQRHFRATLVYFPTETAKAPQRQQEQASRGQYGPRGGLNLYKQATRRTSASTAQIFAFFKPGKAERGGAPDPPSRRRNTPEHGAVLWGIHSPIFQTPKKDGRATSRGKSAAAYTRQPRDKPRQNSV